MRLVSDNSEDDLQRRRAEADLRRVLRGMAANLLRVIRGAGRPYDVGSDLRACVACFQAYRDAFGTYPPSGVIQEILNPELESHDDRRAIEVAKPEWLSDISEYADESRDREFFQQEAWRASLQIVASMMVGQRTQLSQGESDLFRAYYSYRDSSEARKKLQASQKYAPKSKRPSKTAPDPAEIAQFAQIPKRPRALIKVAKPAPTSIPKPEKRERPVPSQRDPFEPPDYSGLRSASLPPAIAEEFGEHSARALVDRLNALWREQGRRPLPQGSYPSNASQLNFVAKELRLALTPKRE